jgi:hypothetical protein
VIRRSSAERNRARALRPLVLAAAFGVASTARADPPVARDPALADSLFRTAVEALAKGDYATACPKFRASMELDPAVSTLLNLAKCDLHENKLARAWATYQRALVINRETTGAQRRRELEEYTQKAIAALEPRVPKLRVVVTSPPAGLSLRRDGETLPGGVLGEEMPTDPGPHRIEASAPGFRTEARDVVLDEGRTLTLPITLVAEAAPPDVTPPPVAPVAVPAVAAPPPTPPPPPVEPRTPPWVWVTGGAGVALAGVAVGFAADGAAAVAKLRRDCPTMGGAPTCPQPLYDQAAVDSLNARKNRDLGVAVGAGIAGGAGLTVAIVGFVRRDARTGTGVLLRPWVGSGTTGLRVGGTF